MFMEIDAPEVEFKFVDRDERKAPSVNGLRAVEFD
jgi:hypothetical protein